ncbi:MAG: AAA family ATPase [Thermotogaceae bacterium]|nr:AAA family ATPase [Thermotogaceae bacterium]
MSARIYSISLKNFRSFRGETKISLDSNCKSILIYGENGSGKSSLYQALNCFLSSGAESPQDIKKFTNIDPSDEESYVKLEIKEDSEAPKIYEWEESADPFNEQLIVEASRTKGFLDYKALLETHFLFRNEERVNIFDLVVNKLLANNLNPVESKTFKEEFKELELIVSEKRSARRSKRLEKALQKFNNGLVRTIQELSDKANEILRKFGQNVKISIALSNGGVGEANGQKELTGKEIILSAQYFGRSLDQHHKFLNEARLSAIAISIYFASILIVPAGKLRVIFLDDICIGLDMSNRRPLLEIINEYFVQKDYQIFLSTFDRYWFELSRSVFANTCSHLKCIELYVGKDSQSKKASYSITKQDRMSYLETAIAYYEACDYPAAANYLRKACESEFRRILPRHLTLDANCETGEVRKISKLENLETNFIKFLQDNGLDDKPFRELKTYKKIVLNPLSHDDLEAPHYGAEIEGGIKLVERLKDIKANTILRAGNDKLKLGIRDKGTQQLRKYRFELLEDLKIIQQGTNPLNLCVCRCRLYDSQNQSSEYASLHAAFDKVSEECGYEANGDYSFFYENVSVSSRKKLEDIMKFDVIH